MNPCVGSLAHCIYLTQNTSANTLPHARDVKALATQLPLPPHTHHPHHTLTPPFPPPPTHTHAPP